ncbi:MAG: citrate lyase acyl carrier protein [Treponemataceae bacterium]
MQVLKGSVCGTLQSNDCLIRLEPAKTLELEIESSVKNEFGEQIEKVIRKTLETYGVKACKLKIEDKGALDCTIAARVQTAIERAACEK